MSKFIEQFASVWKKLGVNQKATILLMLAAGIAGAAVLVHLSRRPSYEMLYSDLDEKDMASVVSYLREAKIPYRVTGGGRTVMVAEGAKYETRLDMAAKGLLPSGPVGLEMFEGNTLAPSPMVEQMMKKRAIQGELGRTIMHMRQVQWAEVQIAMPEATPFAEEQKPVTASIVVQTREGETLRKSQAMAIARLVAGAVEGLDPQNVTLVDAATGNLMSSPQADTTGAEANDAQSFRLAYEEYLAGKAQAILDRALGAGRSEVEVAAVLNMDRITETRESYDAASRVATHERIVSETTNSNAAQGAGSTKEESESSYSVPKTLTNKLTAPGAVERLDVAVIYDPTFTDAEGNEATITDEQHAELEALVAAAVGLDRQRNDTLKVTAMSFRQPAPPAGGPSAALPETGKRDYVLQLVRYGSSIGAALLFVIFVTVALRKTSRRAAATSAPGTGETSPAIAATLLSMSPGGNGNGKAEARERVKDIIASNPITATRLLQRWINEDDPTRKGRRNG